MGQEKPAFTIVSSQPEKLEAQLQALLNACGHGGTRHVAPRALDSVGLLHHEILIVDIASLSEEEIPQEFIDLLGKRPALGLLSAGQAKTSSRLGCACTEVLVWPCALDDLELKLRHLCGQAAAVANLEQTLMLKLNMIGESDIFNKVLARIKKYSKCDAPVLIVGETGTGKELIARAVHYVGLSVDKPFVAVNCGALPDSLIVNELFGHVRGAYTDAREAQAGLVEQAQDGVLFLDEIEALSRQGQVALLRFLQDFQYRSLGSQQNRQARLRLITASNEPLETLVEQGLFRKDLFYRISILALELPPLRERGGDVGLLAEHFVDKYRELYAQRDKYLDPRTLDWMAHYDWPGNVRELDSLILREFLLAESSCISIPPPAGSQTERRSNMPDRRYCQLYNRNLQDAKSSLVREFEIGYLQHTLEGAGGNISEAARKAGKERRTFSKLLDKYGVAGRRYRATGSSS